MKTEQQVRDKLEAIELIIKTDISNHEINLKRWTALRYSRDACRWWLSDKDIIDSDELSKKIDWEITCIESTKNF